MTPRAPLRVLVVDDTVVYRKIVSDILAEVPDVEVVGSAHNGRAALAKIATLKPDLMILDIEMPELTGLEVLDRLQADKSDVGAIMLSTLTEEGGATTIQALQRGAFDFITKPHHAGIAENKAAIKDALAPMLAAYARRKEIRRNLRVRPRTAVVRPAVQSRTPTRATPPKAPAAIRHKPDIIAVAVSTGGPRALSVMIPALPGDIGVPIVIVQHMPAFFTRSLADSLNAVSAIEVREAQDREILQPNTAYIAPGGQQMGLVAATDGRSRRIRITDDAAENSCKPSADYLFRSVASHYLGRALGVVMTGMGSDGAQSMKRMKENGAVIIAQDEATSVVFGMPKAVIDAGIADAVLPLDKIAAEIVHCVRGPRGPVLAHPE